MSESNKRIIIPQENGGCIIITPSFRFLEDGGSIEDLVNELPDSDSVKILDKDNIPEKYRDTWVLDETSDNLVEDFSLSRDVIYKNKLLELYRIKSLEQEENITYTNSEDTYELLNTERSKNKLVARSQIWRNGRSHKKWIDAHGNRIDFTKEDFENIIEIIEGREEVIYIKEAIVKSQIAAITDPVELSGFNVQQAWDDCVV